MKRWRLIFCVTIFLAFAAFFETNLSRTEELPNLDPWLVQFFWRQDFDGDGIYDAARLILKDKPSLELPSNLVYAFFFKPIGCLERIDLAIWLQLSRKDDGTITSIRYLFYIWENDKPVLVGECVKQKPEGLKNPASEPMFEENSKFGRRFFEEWKKLGFSDDKIRRDFLPKWLWPSD